MLNCISESIVLYISSITMVAHIAAYYIAAAAGAQGSKDDAFCDNRLAFGRIDRSIRCWQLQDLERLVWNFWVEERRVRQNGRLQGNHVKSGEHDHVTESEECNIKLLFVTRHTTSIVYLYWQIHRKRDILRRNIVTAVLCLIVQFTWPLRLYFNKF